MFNIEGLVVKLCQLAQEVGDDDRALSLRAAGMQALSSVVSSLDFFKGISVLSMHLFPLPPANESSQELF